ncbi:MAG: hypothetical protein GEU74_08570 [Nitriliruptorales bacterium]|nr:hypothetical protein [Nitriliruptorales bacterium]
MKQGQAAIIAGVGLLVVGGALITLGWDGAASLDYVQGQFPYLLSASVPGIALIIIGMGVLVLAMVRKDAEEREAQLEKLRASINELAGLVGPRDPYDPSVTGEYRPRPRSATNGADSDAATAEIAGRGAFEEGR